MIFLPNYMWAEKKHSNASHSAQMLGLHVRKKSSQAIELISEEFNAWSSPTLINATNCTASKVCMAAAIVGPFCK